MKKFLLKTLGFAVLAFGLAIILDWVICQGLLQMDDYRFQDYRAMLKGGMEHDILIAGNSRGKSHFDPWIIDSTLHADSFCIGVGGYPINVQIAKYNIYRSHNAAPRVLIQNVDFATIRMQKDIRHQHQSEQFFPLVYDRKGREEMSRLGYGFAELNIPLYRMYGYQQVIKNGLLEALHLRHYVSRPAYKGYRPEEGSWNGSELSNMERQEVFMQKDAKQLFESFLADCQTDSLRVVLVNSPMYIGAADKLLGLEKVHAYFDSLANSYGFQYMDYSGHSISLDTNNFCVSVHMNPKAAQTFTRLFCEDLAAVLKR